MLPGAYITGPHNMLLTVGSVLDWLHSQQPVAWLSSAGLVPKQFAFM